MNVSQSSAQTSHPVSSSSSATAASTASVALTESQRARLAAERFSEAQIDDAADAVTRGRFCNKTLATVASQSRARGASRSPVSILYTSHRRLRVAVPRCDAHVDP